MQKLTNNKSLLLATAFAAVAVLAPFGQVSAGSSISVGVDYASGEYGTTTTTNTFSVPLSLKHQTGPWSLRASVPYVYTVGTFNREEGTDNSGKGSGNRREDTTKRSESGLGDLTIAAAYNLIDNPEGFSFDIGAKTKIATADKAKTLITSGENDYSFQVDAFRSLSKMVLFATLGYTIKGEPAGVSLRNPFYSTLGVSFSPENGHTIGAAWSYRQKLTSLGDPVSDLTAFYSMKINPTQKIQFYGLKGLSNGSPDNGGGVVLTHAF